MCLERPASGSRSISSSRQEDLDKNEGQGVMTKLKTKEARLRQKADELEAKLDASETHCYHLLEQNCELKTAIESLETEITEVPSYD